MAKKNANGKSKTATEKMTRSTEPKIQVLARWAGMNISSLAPGWTPDEDYDNEEFDNTLDGDLKQWVIQDNVVCCDNGSVETRRNTVALNELAASQTSNYDGPVVLHKDYAYCANSTGGIYRAFFVDGLTVSTLTLDHKGRPAPSRFTDITILNKMIIATSAEGVLYTGRINSAGICTHMACAKAIPDTVLDPANITVTATGLTSPSCPVSIGFCYSLSNRFGNTRGSKWTNSVVYNLSPAEFNHQNYLTLNIKLPADYTVGPDADTVTKDITGVDIYCHLDDAQDAIFIGHVNIPSSATSVDYKWTGALNTVHGWAMSPLTIPMENMTEGAHGKYCSVLEDKLYVYGGPKSPYRMYYGGNPGNEIQFNRGTGSGWMDADFTEYTQLYDLHNFKTWKANILTVLGDQPNTNRSPRYNIIEHNMAITNEIQVKGMFLERIENVLGVKNRNASIVLFDGLYAINRHGIGLTTMPMSGNVEDKQEYISDGIKPIFQEFLSTHLNKSKITGYKKNLFFALGNDSDGSLENIVFCYNIALKSWFTYSFPEIKGKIRNIFIIDSVNYPEGLGIITTRGIYLVKDLGEHKPNSKPAFTARLETGQISSKQPVQTTSYLEQIELRFDYFIGDLDVTINFIDYWGRKNKVTKHIRVADLKRNWSEWIRIGTYVESYNIQIVGKARFRLTHFMCKVYPQSNRVGLVYGLDDHSSRRHIHGGKHQDIHRYIDSYNNLRDVIMP